MKKAIALCLLVCCMSMSAVAETAIVNTKSSPLTMRATAGDSGKTLVKIPKGETVEVLEKGDWALVAYDGKQGYVNARYLEYIEETPASTPVPTPAPTKEVDFTNVPDDVRELYGKWINVKNGDVYCFDLDGVATHDETSATYQIEGDLVHIFVGVAALIPTTLTINRQAKYPRLVVEDMSSYYVPSTEYEAISAALRDETTQYLTSVEFWTAPASGVVNYVSFNKNGGGWFLLPGDTYSLTWEFVDNDTIKASVDFNGGQSIVLDVVNDNGSLKLINAKGAVAYIPKK